MCSALGYKVRRLRRVRIINIHLGNLAVGSWRDLTASELEGLLPAAGAVSPPASE
jgi:23S rRNA pseudouridine2604 synthase